MIVPYYTRKILKKLKNTKKADVRIFKKYKLLLMALISVQLLFCGDPTLEYIYINQYDIPRRRNLFRKHHASISKTVSRFFLGFFPVFFPVFRIYTNRIYGHRVM